MVVWECQTYLFRVEIILTAIVISIANITASSVGTVMLASLLTILLILMALSVSFNSLTDEDKFSA